MKTIEKQASVNKANKVKADRYIGRQRRSRYLLPLKEHTLLRHSQVIGDYLWLKTLLDKNQRIEERHVSELTDAQRNFINHMLDRVLTQASAEWLGDFKLAESIDEEERRCSLCNQPIKLVFCINNQLNNNSLIVGSTCITHFEINVTGLGKNKIVLKEANKLFRLAKLNQAFPGIVKQIDDMFQSIERHPILIHISLDKSLRERLTLIREMIRGYEANKKADGVFKDISAQLNGCQVVLRQIDQYVTDNISKENIPTRQIVTWLKSKNLTEVIDRLKKDGFITWPTAHRIAEPAFMRSTAKKFNRKLKTIGVTILRVDDKNQNYVIKSSAKPKVLLVSSHDRFVLNYGWLLFDNEDPLVLLNMHNLVKTSSVFYDEPSVSAALEEIERKLKGSVLRLHGWDIDSNDLIIYSSRTARYLITNLKKFLEKFKEEVFGFGQNNRTEIEAYVAGLRCALYTRDELNKLLKDRENAYARQKTFR